MKTIYDLKNHRLFARTVLGKKRNLRNRTLASALALLFSFGAFAQQELTLEDAILKRFSELGPERLSGLLWIPDSEQYCYIKEDVLEIYEAGEAAASSTISYSDINNESEGIVNLESFPRIQWLSNSTFAFNDQQKRYAYNTTSKAVNLLFTYPNESDHLKLNDQNTQCAYIKDDDLYILDNNGVEKQVTTDGGDGIVYGQAVHRNEFGISGGMFWSSDGQKLAFYRMDESMVEEYPLVDVTSMPASTNFIKYPMAGRTSHQVSIGVFDPAKGEVFYLKTGEPFEQYLCSVTWNPSNSEIYVAHLNRDQNHMELKSYSSKSGDLLKTLFEEKDEKYVEPENNPTFLPWDDSKFLWFSERDGFNHLYLYSTDGTMMRQITYGLWEVLSLEGFDSERKNLLLKGTGEVVEDGPKRDDSRNGTQTYVYTLNIESGVKVIVDDRIGTHSCRVSSNGRLLVDWFTNLETPLEYTLFDAQGEQISTLLSSADPLADHKIGSTELGEIVGPDGSSLYTRIIKPSGFESGKKYPVLIYLYGGPHAQLVTNRYLAGAPLWMHWLAEQGYIIATVDNRGSAHRGLEFEQATFRTLGEAEMEDQKLFVDYLKTLDYVDEERLAIHGWSYGGFITTNMLMTFPGTFKAGVAGGPVIDWKYYEVMYTERYMDTPETNPEGYSKTSLLNKAQNLKDDLLIIHGTADPVVVWQHSQKFLKKCIDQGIQLDYFVYPEHPHNVRGKDRIHLIQKIFNYVDARIGDD